MSSFQSELNKPSCTVGAHTRYMTFREPRRVVVVAYRLRAGTNGLTNGAALEEFARLVYRLGVGLGGCMVTVDYGATIYRPEGPMPRSTKKIVAMLQETARGRLAKCPVSVEVVDTHIEARARGFTDVARHSHRLLSERIRGYIRSKGVRGSRPQ